MAFVLGTATFALISYYYYSNGSSKKVELREISEHLSKDIRNFDQKELKKIEKQNSSGNFHKKRGLESELLEVLNKRRKYIKTD